MKSTWSLCTLGTSPKQGHKSLYEYRELSTRQSLTSHTQYLTHCTRIEVFE